MGAAENAAGDSAPSRVQRARVPSRLRFEEEERWNAVLQQPPQPPLQPQRLELDKLRGCAGKKLKTGAQKPARS